MGYVNGKPISISFVYLERGLASVFDIIVLPGMREKGMGKLMTIEAMIEAQTNGFDTCIVTATNDDKYLYQKLGFEEIKVMKVYHK